MCGWQDVERIGGRWAWDTVYRVPATIEGEPMNAAEAAKYIFGLMEKAGYPYMSPELDADIPDCPPQIQVWDDKRQMIRVISFADDEAGSEEALRYSRDTINVMDNPEYGWPEAWWMIGNTRAMIEGWDTTSPIE